MSTKTIKTLLKLPYTDRDPTRSRPIFLRLVCTSGKFIVRTPRLLPRELVEAAERESVSLNAYVNEALARAVGSQSEAPGAS